MCDGLELRFPTEAEWEYACRANIKTATYAGDLEIIKYRASVLDTIAWYDGNSGEETQPVSQKKPNDWGLYDMLGNVYEWCSDWYGDYAGEAVIDPPGSKTGTIRVIRGGSWSSDARYVRAAYCYYWPRAIALKQE